MNASVTPDYVAYNNQFSKTPGAPAEAYQTKLPPAKEALYQKWLDSTSRDVGHRLNPDDPGYDMRGYWRDVVATGRFKRMGQDQHFPDTYKTPYHPTFSRESRFATSDAPMWRDDQLVDAATGQPTQGFLGEMSNQASFADEEKP